MFYDMRYIILPPTVTIKNTKTKTASGARAKTQDGSYNIKLPISSGPAYECACVSFAPHTEQWHCFQNVILIAAIYLVKTG